MCSLPILLKSRVRTYPLPMRRQKRRQKRWQLWWQIQRKIWGFGRRIGGRSIVIKSVAQDWSWSIFWLQFSSDISLPLIILILILSLSTSYPTLLLLVINIHDLNPIPSDIVIFFTAGYLPPDASIFAILSVSFSLSSIYDKSYLDKESEY